MPANVLGEALLAAIGVDALLSPEPLRVTAETRREAGKLGATIRKDLRRFLTAAEFDRDRPLPAFKYREALELLTEQLDASHIAEKLGALKDEAEKMALDVAAGAALAYLRQLLPRRARQTSTGPQTVDPNMADLSAFRRAHAVVNRPLLVLEDLNEGALASDQMDAIAAVYPSIYDVIRQEVFLALADIKAKRPRFELSTKKDKQLQVLLQTRTWNAELARDMQKAFAEVEAAAQSGGGGAPSGPSPMDTPTRRIEAR
jgi:hypothetical protein